MMVSLILVIFMLLLVSVDFKKGLLVFGTFFFFLKYIPGIGSFSIFFLCTCTLLFFGVKHKRKRRLSVPKPILYSSLLMAICWLITEFVSGYHNFLGWFNLVACTFFFPWIMWQYLDSTEIMRRFVKSLIISFLFIQVYGIFQEIFHINPIYSLLNGQFDESAGSYRFGVFRINSFMGFSSTYGTFSACMFFLFWHLRHKSEFFRKGFCFPSRKVPYQLLMALSLFGVICCATRSCYIMFVVMVFGLIMERFDTCLSRRIVLYSFLIFSLVFAYMADLPKMIENLVSFISDSAEGSSSDMRENQLEICLYWVRDSQWWGLGRNFIFQVLALKDEKIFGAESIWFRLIVDYGYVGCVTYILWVLSIVYILWQYNIYYTTILLALFIGKTTSILIDVDFEYFLWMAIVLIKSHQYLFNNTITMRKL